LKTKDFLDSIETSLNIVNICENGGTAKARNIGVERSKGDIIVFLDDDVLLKRKYFENLHKISKNKEISVFA